MTMATTVIGKITETTTETMTMEYPSLAGVKTLKIERQDLEQFRALDDGRVAVQVSGHTESLLYGSDAPFIVTEQDISIVTAMEHNEPINGEVKQMNENIDEDEYNDEVPHFGTQEGRLVMEITADGEMVVNDVGPFDDALYPLRS